MKGLIIKAAGVLVALGLVSSAFGETENQEEAAQYGGYSPSHSTISFGSSGSPVSTANLTKEMMEDANNTVPIPTKSEIMQEEI